MSLWNKSEFSSGLCCSQTYEYIQVTVSTAIVHMANMTNISYFLSLANIFYFILIPISHADQNVCTLLSYIISRMALNICVLATNNCGNTIYNIHYVKEL